MSVPERNETDFSNYLGKDFEDFFIAINQERLMQATQLGLAFSHLPEGDDDNLLQAFKNVDAIATKQLQVQASQDTALRKHGLFSTKPETQSSLEIKPDHIKKPGRTP